MWKKNKNEIEGLFLKPINASIGDMEKFEEKEMTKKRPLAKTTWYVCYVWLINYVLEPIKTLWVVLQTKQCVFLKQIPTRIIVNQNVPTMHMDVEKNQENQRQHN